MADEQNSIDEIFRKSLGDYQEVPPAAAWDDIARKLDPGSVVVKPTPKGSYFMGWPWIALVTVVLIGGIWLMSNLFVTKKEPEKKILVVPVDSAQSTILPTGLPDSAGDKKVLSPAADSQGVPETNNGLPAEKEQVNGEPARTHHTRRSGARRNHPTTNTNAVVASGAQKKRSGVTRPSRNTGSGQNLASDQKTGADISDDAENETDKQEPADAVSQSANRRTSSAASKNSRRNQPAKQAMQSRRSKKLAVVANTKQEAPDKPVPADNEARNNKPPVENKAVEESAGNSSSKEADKTTATTGRKANPGTANRNGRNNKARATTADKQQKVIGSADPDHVVGATSAAQAGKKRNDPVAVKESKAAVNENTGSGASNASAENRSAQAGRKANPGTASRNNRSNKGTVTKANKEQKLSGNADPDNVVGATSAAQAGKKRNNPVTVKEPNPVRQSDEVKQESLGMVKGERGEGAGKKLLKQPATKEKSAQKQLVNSAVNNSKPLAPLTGSRQPGKKPLVLTPAAGEGPKPIPGIPAVTTPRQPLAVAASRPGRQKKLKKEKEINNQRKTTEPEGTADADPRQKTISVLPTEEPAKKQPVVAAGAEDEDAVSTDDAKGGAGGGAAGVPSMKQVKFPPVSLAVLGGYEWALQQPSPNRIAAMLRLLFHFNQRFSVGIQPSYRFGDLPVQTLSNSGLYYNPQAAILDSTSTPIDTFGNRRYTYKIQQSYDSIQTPMVTAGGRLWDVTIPVIFHYQGPMSKWHFYGGPTFTFGGKIKGTTVGTQQTYRRFLVDSITQLTQRPASTFNDYFGLGAKSPQYSSYNANESQVTDPSAVRIGYIAGLGYEVRNFLLDVSIQQQLTGYGQANPALKSVYSSPSFRISIGYRIFNSSPSLKDPPGRNFMQRL